MAHKFFFITTNDQWGGSEELWTRSAMYLRAGGHQVIFSGLYDHSRLLMLNDCKRINYYRTSHSILVVRWLRRLKLLKPKGEASQLIDQIYSEDPSVVIISQGNNVSSLEVMECCDNIGVPYVTITQLVAELNFLGIGSGNLLRLQNAYKHAQRNYFVSRQNLELNNLMLGIRLANSEVVLNPCKLRDSLVPEYPDDSFTYNIALVGRLECYHKGYDLFLNVVAQEKWGSRPVRFNIYGNGPHLEIVLSNIKLNNIKNVFYCGDISDVSDIWRDNHILLMPSRIEGQALALIEAMWCNRCAVITDVGGGSELVEDERSGFIAESASVRAIDDALERAWERKDKWRQMGEEAGSTIRKKHFLDEIVDFNNRLFEVMRDTEARTGS